VIHHGDVRDVLPTLDAESVQCVVTSPPYWGLRDYGVEGQIGLEATPEQYVQTLVAVFREVRRVLRDDGTVWLNMGDSYASSGIDTRGAYSTKSTLDKGRWSPASGRQYDEQKNPVTTVKTIPPGLKPKDLIGIPWRVAFALQADGWYLRSDIVWAKGVSFCPDYSGSVMPESVTDRPTKGHEYLFLLSKQPRYYYDAEAVRETARYPDGANAPDKVASPYGQGFTANRSTGASSGGRNLRSVWAINPQPYSEAHFAITVIVVGPIWKIKRNTFPPVGGHPLASVKRTATHGAWCWTPSPGPAPWAVSRSSWGGSSSALN
jgi:DNA modification methylase